MSQTTVTLNGAGANVTEVRPSFIARHFTITDGAFQAQGLTLSDGGPTVEELGRASMPRGLSLSWME